MEEVNERNKSGSAAFPSPWGVASLALGMASFVCCCLPLGLPGIVCGHIGLRRIRKSGGDQTGKGFCRAGLIISYISSIILLIIATTTILSIWLAAKLLSKMFA